MRRLMYRKILLRYPPRYVGGLLSDRNTTGNMAIIETAVLGVSVRLCNDAF
jgi:hypothetical protein